MAQKREYEPTSIGNVHRFEWTVRQDGALLAGATVTFEIERPGAGRGMITLTATEQGTGIYRSSETAATDFDRRGNYTVGVKVVKGSIIYRTPSSQRRVLRVE